MLAVALAWAKAHTVVLGLGGVVVLLLCVALAMCCCRRRAPASNGKFAKYFTRKPNLTPGGKRRRFTNDSLGRMRQSTGTSDGSDEIYDAYGQTNYADEQYMTNTIRAHMPALDDPFDPFQDRLHENPMGQSYSQAAVSLDQAPHTHGDAISVDTPPVLREPKIPRGTFRTRNPTWDSPDDVIGTHMPTASSTQVDVDVDLNDALNSMHFDHNDRPRNESHDGFVAPVRGGAVEGIYYGAEI